MKWKSFNLCPTGHLLHRSKYFKPHELFNTLHPNPSAANILISYYVNSLQVTLTWPNLLGRCFHNALVTCTQLLSYLVVLYSSRSMARYYWAIGICVKTYIFVLPIFQVSHYAVVRPLHMLSYRSELSTSMASSCFSTGCYIKRHWDNQKITQIK